MKKSMMMVVICGWCVLTGYSATNYVDRATGDDGYNGTTPATAKRTIQAAVDIANAGDTVLVAPGVYDEGMTVTPNGWLANRVVITKNITLKSTHGMRDTVILGARDPVDITFEGCGSNAVRCVYMSTGTLKGFTLTGGASGSESKEDINNRGGGLYASKVSDYPVVYDCIISNNAALRGGGVYAGTLHRCLVAGNFAKVNGGGVRETKMHDSLIVYNSGGGVYGSYSNTPTRISGVYNCTVAHNSGYGLDQSSGFNTIDIENTSHIYDACLSNVTFVNCCLSAATTRGTNNIVATDVHFVDAANGDFRMLEGSPCFDAGDSDFNGSASSADQRSDYLGNPRVQGSSIDIGAIEGVAANIATVTCVAPTGSGSLTPIGHFVLTTLPTQLVFSATAEEGSALRHFTVNNAKMMDCGNTFLLNVTRAESHTVSAVFLPARYVDAESGSDLNDGQTPGNAWRTLQHAVDTAPLRSMVVAAPGFYDEGGMVGLSHNSRVHVRRLVVLKGSGAGRSFIVGASDSEPGHDDYGCGVNAVRCVSMTIGTLEGFTLTGGRSSNARDGWNSYGGGCGVSPFTGAQIWDCVISNNVANRAGGAVFGGVYHRCRIEENQTTSSTGASNRYGTCYDCLIAHNIGWATANGAKLYNCTVTANDKGIRNDSTTWLFNSIIYGNDIVDIEAGSRPVVTNCCTGGDLRPGEGNIAADPLFVDMTNSDYRLRADSPCRDTGNAAYSYEPEEGTDLAGAPRLIGAQVNMGAFESCVGVINAVTAPGSTITPSGLLLFDSFPTNVTFTASALPGRTLLYFSTNGVPVPYVGNTITVTVPTPETGIQLQAHFEGIFYVDPMRPDDSGDGGSWLTAKRTLQAAVDLAFDNETVIAAPGVYSEGTRLTPLEYTTDGYLKNRVLITNDITLCSRDGAATTAILGAFDNSSGDSHGRGSNAVRCVYMSKGTIEGFTITGGATGNENKEDQNNRGGGVYVNYGNTAPLVLDCVISNNAAGRGGGTYFGTLKRCQIRDNYASINGGGIRNGIAHNCLIVENRGARIVAYATIYHCTVADNESTGISDGTLAYNCISSGNTGSDISTVCTNCCSPTLAPGYGNIEADPLFVDSANGDYRLAADSPCIDSANPEYTEDFCGVTLDGALRTQNCVPDIGVYEWDWRAVFAADLDGFGLTVTEVTPFVKHVTDAAYMGGSAVYLDGAAARANGAESVELVLSWNLRSANTGFISFEVDGRGTLTLYEGEQPIAVAVLADGTQTIKYTVLQKPAKLRAVYTVPEGETGGALLDAFEGIGGLILLLR